MSNTLITITAVTIGMIIILVVLKFLFPYADVKTFRIGGNGLSVRMTHYRGRNKYGSQTQFVNDKDDENDYEG